MQAPDIPLVKARYLPDRHEPVDRWFQAKNAGNAETTAQFIAGICDEEPELVIDPFCGSGSTATAARLLGLPFYGIDSDPVLSCVSLAKTSASGRHATLLPALPEAKTPGQLASALGQIRSSCDREDARVVSALTVLSAFRRAKRRPLAAATIAGDLAAWPDPVPGGYLTRGDARSAVSWARLGLPQARVVMYTSPPFGLTSPVIHPPAYVRRAAISVLGAFDADVLGETTPEFPGYAELVIGMFRQAAAYLTRGTLIVEHEPDGVEREPDDPDADETAAVIRAVDAEFEGVIHSPRVIRCGAFSKRGMLTLMIFDLR